jgi:hypothetical protein
MLVNQGHAPPSPRETSPLRRFLTLSSAAGDMATTAAASACHPAFENTPCPSLQQPKHDNRHWRAFPKPVFLRATHLQHAAGRACLQRQGLLLSTALHHKQTATRQPDHDQDYPCLRENREAAGRNMSPDPPPRLWTQWRSGGSMSMIQAVHPCHPANLHCTQHTHHCRMITRQNQALLLCGVF